MGVVIICYTIGVVGVVEVEDEGYVHLRNHIRMSLMYY